MTVFTRYVNTASTAGGDGTTNATTGANRAYFSIERALSFSATAIADGDEWVFECCGTAADDGYTGAPITFAGWTIAGTGKITIRANRSDAAGFYSGPLAYSTSHYRLEFPSGVALIYVNINNVTIDGIQGAVTGSPGRAIFASYSDAARNTVVENCRLKGNGSTGSGLELYQVFLSYDGVYAAHNNIIVGFATGIKTKDSDYGAHADAYIYNNTIVSSTTGIDGPVNLLGGSCWIRNNAISGTTTAVSCTADGGTVHTNYNAYDTGQAGNATGTAVSDWTTAFTDPSGGDYSVKSGSPLIGGGVSAAADSQVPGQDLLGRARAPGACDLGVFSFVTQTAQEPVWSALSFV